MTVLAISMTSSVTFAQSDVASKQTSDSLVRPQYELLRDEEEWATVQDHAHRTDMWDAIKFIPFRWPDGSSLSIGGEVRQQYERFANEGWGSESTDRSGHLLQRYMLHTHVRFGRIFRVFTQIKSGIEAGRAGGPRPPDEDRLDLHQGYAAVEAGSPFIGTTVSVRVGRQEFQFGSGRLISVRERPNVRQSFDALRVIVRHHTWRTDAFVSRPVSTSRGVFDDRRDDRRALWGIYAVRGTSLSRGVDLYYLGYSRQRGRFDQGTADEQRHSGGIRMWGQRGPTDYNTEVVGQWGTFGEARIRAWTVASDTGYRLRSAGDPRIGVRADVTSGDRNPIDNVLGTFNPLFPKGAYFGLIAPTGPLNHIDLHPSIAFVVARNWAVSAGWSLFWRTRHQDGLYGVAGTLLRSGEGTRARFIGHSPGLEVEWQTNQHLSITANLSLFSAGSFLKESPPSRTTRYAATWAAYTF